MALHFMDTAVTLSINLTTKARGDTCLHYCEELQSENK